MRALRLRSPWAVLGLLVAFLTSSLVVLTPSTAQAVTGVGIDFENLTEAQWRAYLRDHELALNVPSSAVKGGKGMDTPGSVGKGLSPRQAKAVRIAAAQRNAAKKKRRVAGQPVRPQVVIPQAQSPATSAAKGSAWKAKIARGAVGVGNALFYGFVFDVAYSGAGWVMETAFGIESDGFTCDMQQVVGADLGMCAYQVGDEWEVNGDIFTDGPGWVGVPEHSWNIGQFTLGKEWTTVTEGIASVSDEFHVRPGGPITVAVNSFTQTPPEWTGSENYWQSSALGNVAYRVYCKTPAGGNLSALRRGTSSNLTFTYECPTQGPSPLRSVLDRVEVAQGTWWGGTGWMQGDGFDAFAIWYPQGHELRPPDIDEDPERMWRTSWKCLGADEQITEFETTGAPWRESDPLWPNPPEAECIGSTLIYQRIDQLTVGLEDYWTLSEWEMDDAVLDWQEDYPECVSGECLLILHKIDHQTNTRLSCFTSPDPCAEWFQDPQKVENYACTYGAHDVDLEECNVYAPLFDRDKRKHGDPDDGSEPDPDWKSVPSPDPGGPPPGGPPADPNCPPPFSWLSLFNPWWYYQGVSCALKEAFVPSQAVVTSAVTDLSGTVTSRPPGSLITVATPVVQGLGEGWSAGCSGGLADFGEVRGTQLVVPCNPPESTTIASGRALMLVAIVLTTAFALWHMAVAAIGGNDGDSGA